MGTLPPELMQRVQALDLTQIEALGEALLDFKQVEDLATWLDS